MSGEIKYENPRCKQCQLTIDIAHTKYVEIYDKDTNEYGYLHHSCERPYAHQRNFRILEEHVSC
jgi:hypothetical protein